MSRKPQTILWFQIFCGACVVMYLLLTVLGIAMLVSPEEFANDLDPSEPDPEVIGAVYAVIGVLFSIPYAIGIVIPQKPWAWIFGIVLIAFSLLSCCCWPAGIPLLIFWLKPPVKVWFGREAPRGEVLDAFD